MIQALSSISKKSLGLLLLAFLLAPAAAFSLTSVPDVGLVTRLTGEATYRNSQEKKPAAVMAFMKVRQGDNLKLAQDSSLTLLYFADGRQETWKGPATFVAGAGASKATGRKKAATPEVKMMPTSAVKKIAAAPFLLARADAGPAAATQIKSGAPGSSGAIQTTALVCKLPPPGPSPEKAQKMLKEGQAVYQDLKKQAEPDDFTPELYFLGVLAECRRYSEMNKMLDEMLQKKPGDEALKKMKSWVRTQTLCGG